MAYSIVDPLPNWITFTADNAQYTQTVVVDHANALAAMGANNEVVFTSKFRTVYG